MLHIQFHKAGEVPYRVESVCWWQFTNKLALRFVQQASRWGTARDRTDSNMFQGFKGLQR